MLFSPRRVIGVASLLAPLALLVHCTSEGAADPSPDGGTSDEMPDETDEEISPVTGGDGGASVVGSDGGTIDSGRDAGVITVCGGSKGDPSAVPLLDWKIYTFPPKYSVLLGAGTPKTEPVTFSSTIVLVNGSRSDDTSQSGTGTFGAGLFGTTALNRANFVAFTMPRTEVASTSQKTLGWSDALGLTFDVRTSLAVSGFSELRAGGSASHVTRATWTLATPSRSSTSSSYEYYASQVTAEHGVGWFLTVLFDHPCKVQAFDALVGKDPVRVLDPPSPRTRAEVSNFLVDNDARLLLTVTTVGVDDPGLQAALTGTQASGATLDELETALTALKAAIGAHWAALGPADYDSVAAGTNPSWVIGSVTARPLSELPSP